MKVGKQSLPSGKGDRAAPSTSTWLGALFESLATQSVRVYADAVSANVGHLRTKDTTREIDLIVKGDDRQVVAIEVKLAVTVSDHDVRHLNWLQRQIGDRLADRVVITTGKMPTAAPTASLSYHSHCSVRDTAASHRD
ncbi:MAG: DUF4143 domain-containing protein [Ilumatobacteraceae bacterium]|nr:DUF4143 domain-containing protein [Ilumatobacteraceae bacterium]